MEANEFSRLREYMARGQLVRLDIRRFSDRELSGIKNGLSKGYWLSAGKIAWLADQIAERYKLPFVQYKRGSYGYLAWNTQAAELPGFADVLTALHAYERMVEPSRSADDNWRAKNCARAIANPLGTLSMPLINDAAQQVASQMKSLERHKNVDAFLNDLEQNNIWLPI